MLSAFGVKRGQRTLQKKEYDEARQIVELERDSDKKTFSLQISTKELKFLRKVMLWSYRNYRNIPDLSREQYIVSLVITFETYINDTIRNILSQVPNSLKSTKSSVRDEEIVGLSKS